MSKLPQKQNISECQIQDCKKESTDNKLEVPQSSSLSKEFKEQFEKHASINLKTSSNMYQRNYIRNFQVLEALKPSASNTEMSEQNIFVQNNFFKRDDQDIKMTGIENKMLVQIDDKRIDESLDKNIEFAIPILRLEIIHQQEYQLDENDLRDLFMRYGRVVKIIIKKSNTAFIIYNDIMAALYAQKSLNDHYLKDVGVKLIVSQCNPTDIDWSSNEFKEIKKIRKNAQELINKWNKEVDITTKKLDRPLPNLPLEIPVFPYIPVKFTCKYEIQIKNDKSFQVARRIIGPRVNNCIINLFSLKGCNMKKIIFYCQTIASKLKIANNNDLIKLRLRGKGSGFKEGFEKKESEEPMHLCVSSKYIEVYKTACKSIEQLLQDIYKEYEDFCKKTGKESVNLGIKRLEDYSLKNFNEE